MMNGNLVHRYFFVILDILKLFILFPLLKRMLKMEVLNFQATTMTPKDPRWIGAWWVGFLLFGSLALVVSILVLMFPRTIPEPKIDGEKSNETEDSSNKKSASNDDFSVIELLKGIHT